MGPSPKTLAVANALSGDRTCQQIEYPLTGDAELDLMSALTVLFKPHNLSSEAVKRVAGWMVERFGTRTAQQGFDWAKSLSGTQQAQQAQQAAPMPYHPGSAWPSPTTDPFDPFKIT